MSPLHEPQVDRRFGFGANWRRFLRHLDSTRIEQATESLRKMLGVDDLKGKTFLDVGCGSGLFSLAAHNLGARVHSFDYDQESVACALELRNQFGKIDHPWTIERGSALDNNYLGALGRFDIVYSWGVLHHTGDMWNAISNIARLATNNNGILFISIYNDQGWISRYWLFVKRRYNSGALSKLCVMLFHMPYLTFARGVVRAFRGQMSCARGMSLWFDMIDWLGGYPFEVATPGQIVSFLRPRGFCLLQLVTCGGRHGCNEFVFERGDGQDENPVLDSLA